MLNSLLKLAEVTASELERRIFEKEKQINELRIKIILLKKYQLFKKMVYKNKIKKINSGRVAFKKILSDHQRALYNLKEMQKKIEGGL